MQPHAARARGHAQHPGPGLASAIFLCRVGMPENTPYPVGGRFAEPGCATWLPRLPSTASAFSSPPAPHSTAAPRTRWEPPQWPPVAASLSQPHWPTGDAPTGQLKTSPPQGEGLRVQEGPREHVSPPSVCLLPRRLALPLFLWSWQARPSGCPRLPQPRPAHQNPSPRTLNHHGLHENQR